MFTVEVTGFQTKLAAEQFIHWFDGQGEQDAAIWMEENAQADILTDTRRTFPFIWKENSVTMYVTQN